MNKELNEIWVVGAGAVGGFFGAHLARVHPGVSFLLRPRTCEVIKKKGLNVYSRGESFRVTPRCATNPRELPSPDLIILATKLYDLPEVLEHLGPILNHHSLLLTLQNGVTSEDTVQDQFGRGSVLGGLAFIYSKMKEVGVIEHYKRGTVMIGEMMGQENQRVQAVANLFRQAGIPCEISPDIRRAKWEKMCWNCVFNPLTVLINDRVARALDQPDMARVIRSIVEEVCAIAMAHRVPLDESMPDTVVRMSHELRDIHTSMYDDWKAGRPTEIDGLNGYIVKKGREFGIPTPVNEMLAVLIQSLTANSLVSGEDLCIVGEALQPIHVSPLVLCQLPAEGMVPDIGTVVSGMRGKGVRVKVLLDMVTPQTNVDHVTFHSRDRSYAASLSLNQARDFGILVYELDGEPLPREKGGPFRLITPGLDDLCANVKDVSRIQLSHGMGSDTRSADTVC